MQACKVNLFYRVITYLVMAFFALLVGSSVYVAVAYWQAGGTEWRIFLAEAVLFGGFLLFALYRLAFLGPAWVEYDKRRVILHCSSREEYSLLWEDIPSDKVRVEAVGGGYIFWIEKDGRRRRLPVGRMMRGYRALEAQMSAAGVLKRIGAREVVDMKEVARQMFSQFEQYRAAHPDATKPKPAGACLPCPDCGGRGVRPKTLPLLRLTVGRVCKTCGGSGWVSG